MDRKRQYSSAIDKTGLKQRHPEIMVTYRATIDDTITRGLFPTFAFTAVIDLFAFVAHTIIILTLL